MIRVLGHRVEFDGSLQILNCKPVRFADTIHDCLVKDHPEGLNSNKQFNYVMLDTDMVDDRILTRMKELQPDARVSRAHDIRLKSLVSNVDGQMLYLVRSIDLAKTIRELSITVSHDADNMSKVC